MPDMEKVIKGLEEIANDKWMKTHADWYVTVCCDALALLKDQEEIRHGEWKWSHGGECSECGYHNSNFNYKYCPMCGAMMDA